MSDTIRLFCALTFLFAGLCFLFTGWLLLRKRRQAEVRCQGSAWGIVEAIHFGTAVYTYHAGGREMRVRSHYRCRPSPFRVGQRVTVFYDPSDPEVFCVEEERRIGRFLSTLFLGFGVLFLAVSPLAGFLFI